MKKKILLGVLVILGLMQLYRPEKNKSDKTPVTDLLVANQAPENVSKIMKSACYDCHSNNTEGYLWYYEIAPVSWWIASHVNEGKEHLNFSEWTNERYKDKAIDECVSAINDGWMPIESYTWTHSKAKLSAEDKKVLTDWFNSIKGKK